MYEDNLFKILRIDHLDANINMLVTNFSLQNEFTITFTFKN